MAKHSERHPGTVWPDAGRDPVSQITRGNTNYQVWSEGLY